MPEDAEVIVPGIVRVCAQPLAAAPAKVLVMEHVVIQVNNS